MQFNYFRVVLALLVSLGPFFAYICRLNLSLVIYDMVESSPLSDTDKCVEPNFPTDCKYDYREDIGNTEDHALAWLSREFGRQARVHRLIEERDSRRGLRPNISSSIFLGADSASVLSVDFDVDPQSNQKSSEKTTTGSDDNIDSVTTTQSSVETERVTEKLKWSETEQNALLTFFFAGYVIFQIPAARAAEMFGAKSLFVVSGLGHAFCAILFPSACKISYFYAALSRALLGAFQSTIFPAAYVLLCEWLPKSERSRWLPIPSAFSRFGTIAMNIVVPKLVDTSGWEMVFYLSGTLILGWTILFMIFASSSPDQSYWLSKAELIHIESHMEPRVGTSQQQVSITASGFTINEDADAALSKPRLSWSRLVRNRAVMILTVVMFTSEWSNMLLLVLLPGFLKKALAMSTQEAANWGTVLVLVYCIQFPLSGALATRLESAEGLDSLRVRKIFEATSHTLQAIGALVIAFSSSTGVIVAALILMMLGRATVGGGQCLMPPELSRDYSGTVFAYANSLANLAGFFGPYLVPVIVADQTQLGSWVPLWILSAALFVINGLIFVIFAENESQNYCKKPKARAPGTTTSQAQLTSGKAQEEPEIFKMDAFARVTSEPRGARTRVGGALSAKKLS